MSHLNRLRAQSSFPPDAFANTMPAPALIMAGSRYQRFFFIMAQSESTVMSVSSKSATTITGLPEADIETSSRDSQPIWMSLSLTKQASAGMSNLRSTTKSTLRKST